MVVSAGGGGGHSQRGGGGRGVAAEVGDDEVDEGASRWCGKVR
jgi:hypothetical protein